MKWSTSSAAIMIAAALSAAAAAQSSTMAESHKMDMKDVTYTGCLGAGNAVGTFTLTHLTTPAHMRLDVMQKSNPKKAAPVAATLSLMSSSVDLSMNLGREVSVTGLPAQQEMGATPFFSVKSLKVVAASCP
jgi:hypothetical protein